ncbi:hypothetical protein AC249_AIPGENE21467 [Exaiptasia diaphana]|nr:hypothetical protein AC249_AIPGENE21467 [Exaiptasia diaphana]
MSCILHMMKAQGTIDWDKQVLELLFQWIWTIIIVTIFLVGLGWSIGSLTRSVVCGCLKGIFDRSNQ